MDLNGAKEGGRGEWNKVVREAGRRQQIRDRRVWEWLCTPNPKLFPGPDPHSLVNVNVC